MNTRHFLSFLLLGLIVTASEAYAQDDSTPASPLSGLYECAAMADDTARLACFDSKVAGIRTAENNKELVAIDKNSARLLKKEAFGFNLPSLPKLGLPSLGMSDNDEEALTIAVKSVNRANRKYTFVMENGQVWQESGGRLNYIPKGDLTATIKPAAIGSYVISISNGKERVRGLKVRRVE